MAKYSVESTTLKATADAIREKTGSSGLIEWKDETGFADAIEGISSGSGDGSGGNSSEIETCTVIINTLEYRTSGSIVSAVNYVTNDGGVLKSRCINNYDDEYVWGITGAGSTGIGVYTIECVVGTDIMLFDETQFSGFAITIDGNATVRDDVSVISAYSITIHDGETVTISVDLP